MRTSIMIEVFDPKNGKPVVRVRWTFVAKLITSLFGWLDYAEENNGWVQTGPTKRDD